MSADTWVVNRPAKNDDDDDTILVVTDSGMSGYPATLHLSTSFGDRAVMSLSPDEIQALIVALQERLVVAR